MIRGVNRLFRFAALSFSLLLFLAAYILVTLPNVESIKGCMTTVMYEVDLCPKRADYVGLGLISPHLKNAILVSEDSAFYQHNGFDFAEIQASLEQNLRSGKYLRGGSTITQQLAKNAFLTFEKTPLRKVREALITVQLEEKLTKNQIFEKYLNIVEFGPGIFGVKRAAQFYFKKPPRDLNSLEAAFLAFLLPSPQKHSVSFRKKTLSPFARQSVMKILSRLTRFQRLSGGEFQWAASHLADFPWYGITGYGADPVPDGPILDLPQGEDQLEPAPIEEEPDELIEEAVEEELEPVTDSETI